MITIFTYTICAIIGVFLIFAIDKVVGIVYDRFEENYEIKEIQKRLISLYYINYSETGNWKIEEKIKELERIVTKTSNKTVLLGILRGMISVEDLWDLKLEQLDEVYKNLMIEIKKANEESLLKSKTKDQTALEMKVDIVKHIVNYKIKETETKEQEIKRKAQKQKILEILNEKENQDLQNMSVEELKEMLNNI